MAVPPLSVTLSLLAASEPSGGWALSYSWVKPGLTGATSAFLLKTCSSPGLPKAALCSLGHPLGSSQSSGMAASAMGDPIHLLDLE